MPPRIDIDEREFRVREECELSLSATPSEELGPGETAEFQLPHTWTALRNGGTYTKQLQTADPQQPHYVSIDAPTAEFDVEIRSRQLPDTDERTRHGRHVVGTVTDGSVPSGEPLTFRFSNTSAPYIAGEEDVWVRVDGERPDERVTLEVTPDTADHLRVIAPSGVEPGEEFDVVVVSLDQYQNESATQYTDRDLRRTDGAIVGHDLSFTGSLRVPTAVESQGIYRFEFDDTVSNAVRVEQGSSGPYWGDIHIHTGLSHDAQGNDPYSYARRVSALEFAATTEHVGSLGERSHERILEAASEANDPGEFVTLPAYEPTGLNGGHFNFYFRSRAAYERQRDADDAALLPGDVPESEKPGPDEFMAVPHHTGVGFGPGGSATVDMSDCGVPDLCPAVEIYSHHGQSERYAPQHALAYEFNRYRLPERRVNYSRDGPFYAQDYWTAGYRFGTVCSSDVHTGQGGCRNNGIVAVFSDELTREAVFDGIRQRQTYGTTGERILLEFTVEETPMGGVTTADLGDSLSIDVDVWGTDSLLNVEVLRHRFDEVGDEGGKKTPNSGRGEFTPVHAEAPTNGANTVAQQRPETWNASFNLEDEFRGPVMYYARVTQAPVERPAMAWSSPVWIEPETE